MFQIICLDSESDEEKSISKDHPRKKRRIQPTPVIEDVVTAEQASAILSECTLTPIRKSESKHNESIETVTLDSDDETKTNASFQITNNGSFDLTMKDCKTKTNIKTIDNFDCLDLRLEPLKNGELTKAGEIQNMEFVNLTDDDLHTDNALNKINKESSVEAVNNLKLNSTNCDSIELVSLSDDEVEDTSYLPDPLMGKKYGRHEWKKGESLSKNKNEINSKNNGEVSETVSLDETDSEDERSKVTIDERISDSSIIINDSDTESSKTGKENQYKNGQHQDIDNETENRLLENIKPSTSKQKDNCETKTLLKKFLNLVKLKVVESEFEKGMLEKIPQVEKYFYKCGHNTRHKYFTTLLNECILKTKSGAASTAVIAFHQILEHLKLLNGRATVAIEEQHVPILKKLEKTIKLLTRKIKQLDESDVNFDDDDDSTYIQADKYQRRLNKVYAKYCKYIRKNPHSGRITYDKINFCNSSYNEINLAINRKYKNSLKFPNYHEMEKYIGKISKTENLNLSEAEIKYESGRCFKELGRILQKRRKTELYEGHVDFIQNTEDPASKDIHLENTLKKNFIEGESKIEKLCQKYSARQDLGEDKVSTSPGSSDCSDDEQPT